MTFDAGMKKALMALSVVLTVCSCDEKTNTETKAPKDISEPAFPSKTNDAEKHQLKEFMAPQFIADAEDLAEQGVFGFLGDIAQELAMRGVHLPTKSIELQPRKIRDPETGKLQTKTPTRRVIDDSIPDTDGIEFIRPAKEDLPESGAHYRVTVGRHTIEIWNSAMSGATTWEAAMNHTLILVNLLLEDAGSHERIYGLAGGHEGAAVFLTPAQFSAIKSSADIPDRQKPCEARRIN